MFAFKEMRRFRWALGMIGVITALSGRALGQVDLEWRVVDDSIRVGDTIEVSLYAVPQSASEALFGVIAILDWDEQSLRLLGYEDVGPFPLTGFFDDFGLDGLNADCGPDTFCTPFTQLPFNDGDAVFNAGVFFSESPVASPDGLLVDILQFQAMQPTAAATLALAETMGATTETVVIRDTGDGGNEPVTGRLGTLAIPIADCGEKGDFDGDCLVDRSDHVEFAACLLGVDTIINGSCDPADFDSDGDSDLRDAAAMQRWFTGRP